MAQTDIDAEAIAGVILAGGQSRRMGGGDKTLAVLAGEPLIAHVVGRLRPQVARLALNANGDPRRFAAFGLPVIPDATSQATGPLAGILAGMNWAAANGAGARWMVTTPADTPFIPRDLVARLRAAAPNAATIVVARSRGTLHPVVALFPVALRDDLAAWLAATADRAVRSWIGRHASVAVDFADADGGVDPFFNINTPDDLERAAGLAMRAAGSP